MQMQDKNIQQQVFVILLYDMQTALLVIFLKTMLFRYF